MLQCNYQENKSENATNVHSPINAELSKFVKTQTNNKLTISIQDHGIGMTEEQIKMALDGKGTQIDKSALKNHHYQTQHHYTKPMTKGNPNIITIKPK